MIRYRGMLLAAICTVAGVALWGCGKEASMDTTTITIQKDGKISSVIVETFEEDNYSEEGLKKDTEVLIEAYNTNNGDGAVVLNDLKVKDKIASPSMTYQSAAVYKSFNGKELFYGTVAEAYDADYTLDITLKNVSDEAQTINKNDILALGNMHIVIAEEPIHIRTFNNIEYMSENVTLVHKKEAAIATDSDQLAYILFK